MKSIHAAILIAATLCLSPLTVNAEGSLSVAEQAAIQAAMQRHIDRNLVDGTVLYIDHETGEVRPLYPVTAHPMILAYGEHFVLCFDFRDDDGQNVPIDYYMARQDNGFVVFHTAVADRALLQTLMSDGKVTRLN